MASRLKALRPSWCIEATQLGTTRVAQGGEEGRNRTPRVMMSRRVTLLSEWPRQREASCFKPRLGEFPSQYNYSRHLPEASPYMILRQPPPTPGSQPPKRLNAQTFPGGQKPPPLKSPSPPQSCNSTQPVLASPHAVNCRCPHSVTVPLTMRQSLWLLRQPKARNGHGSG